MPFPSPFAANISNHSQSPHSHLLGSSLIKVSHTKWTFLPLFVGPHGTSWFLSFVHIMWLFAKLEPLQQVPHDDQGILKDKQFVSLAHAHCLGLPQQLAIEYCQTNCLEHTISLVFGSLLEALNLTLSFPVVPTMLAHTLVILVTLGPPIMVRDMYQYLKHYLSTFLLGH